MAIFPALVSFGEEKKPKNIIFILTDDQRFDAVGYYPSSKVITPNIDKLASKGTIFNNAFVTLSICAPSRVACMTGRYGSSNCVMKLNDKMRKSEKTFVMSYATQVPHINSLFFNRNY